MNKWLDEAYAQLKQCRLKWQETNMICFTMDTDWASEYVLQHAVNFFKEHHILLTVFCTNKSEFLQKEARAGTIDLQIHPNFIMPSSQGKTEDDVINFCKELVPEASVFRAHRWYASNDIYEKLYRRGIRYESNVCTLFDMVLPYLHRSGMVAFPVFFEDGAIIERGFSLKFNDTKEKYEKKGLKIINFHPMHFALNTPCFSYTRQIKDRLTREQWNNLDDADIEKLRFQGDGITNYLKELVFFAESHSEVCPFKDLYKLIQVENLS